MKRPAKDFKHSKLADAPHAASSLVAGGLCAFERKTHATHKLRVAPVRVGSIFFKSLRTKIVFVLLSVRRVGASYVSMNQSEQLVSLRKPHVMVCDGVSKHFGPTSVPTYRSSSPKLA